MYIFTVYVLTIVRLWTCSLSNSLDLECESYQDIADVASGEVSLLQVGLDIAPTSLSVDDRKSAEKGERHGSGLLSSRPHVSSKATKQTSHEASQLRDVGKILPVEPTGKDKTKAILVEDRTMVADETNDVFDIKKCSFVCLTCALLSIISVALLRWFAPDFLSVFFYVWIYVATSGTLIMFNKYLMADTVFPYAAALTAIHMTTTWLGLFAIYCVRPAMFPSMEMERRGPAIFGVAFSLPRFFFPLGVLFAIGLFGGNAALHYCSVAFLQFMKESNVVWVFSISVLVGLQDFSKVKVFTLLWIVVGASLTITGEMNFSVVGFLFQAGSLLGECSKNVLGEFMMTSSNFRLDALTYTMSLAPMALIPLGVGTYYIYEPRMVTALFANAHMLAINSLVAVGLNVCGALLIKNCNAVSFVIAGIFKDIVIVIASSYIYSSSISAQQVVGFVVCLSGMFAFSSIRVKPEWWGLEEKKM